MTRQPTPEVIKLIGYHPDFFGEYMKKVTHEAMRGPSAWSVADRELMAALVSRVNACEFCIKAHTAVAVRAYGDEPMVAAVLSDLEAAPVSEPLRATLRMLVKLTREQTVGADDLRSVLAAGGPPQQIEDALGVCFAFNTINRLAETFAFSVPGPRPLRPGRSSCSLTAIAEERVRSGSGRLYRANEEAGVAIENKEELYCEPNAGSKNQSMLSD